MGMANTPGCPGHVDVRHGRMLVAAAEAADPIRSPAAVDGGAGACGEGWVDETLLPRTSTKAPGERGQGNRRTAVDAIRLGVRYHEHEVDVQIRVGNGALAGEDGSIDQADEQGTDARGGEVAAETRCSDC